VKSEYFGFPFAQASPAMAPIGHRYLHTIPLAFRCWNVSFADELSLNLDDFTEEDREELPFYIE
jgi:hypothetical protein